MATATRVPFQNEIFVTAGNAVQESATTVARVAAALESAAKNVRRGIVDTDPSPKRFVGYIREYRYTAGRKGEMPSHRFYLECGRGIWLYARVSSSVFEPIMLDAAMELEPSNLNGLMLFMVTGEADNTLVPVEIVNGLGVPDRFGSYLYESAPVICPGGVGEVMSWTGDELMVQLDGSVAYYARGDVARLF